MLDIHRIQQEGERFLYEGPLNEYFNNKSSGRVFGISAFTFLAGAFVVLFRVIRKKKPSRGQSSNVIIDSTVRELNEINYYLKKTIIEKSNSYNNDLDAECRLDGKNTLIVLFSSNKSFSSSQGIILSILEQVHRKVKPSHIKYVELYYKIRDKSNFEDLFSPSK